MYLDLNDVLKRMVRNLLEQNYETVFVVNPEDNTAREYVFDEALRKDGEEMKLIQNAQEYLNRYFEENYEGDDLLALQAEVKIERMMERLRKDSSAGFSYSVCKNGHIRRLRVEYRFLHPEWELICITRQDITTIYEEERRKENLVGHSLDIAQRAVEGRSGFLFQVSQDIRNPLYALSGMLDVAIEQQKSGKDSTEYLLQAKQSMINLSNMLLKLLNLATIEHGELGLESSPFILETFLKEIADSLQLVAKEKNQQVIFEVVSPKLQVIKGDPVYWRQVFMMIMDNSLRYGKENGYAKCTITSRRAGNNGVYATITFTDNGRGMSREEVAHAFDDFYALGQMQDSLRGLGLPIVHNIVKQSGGTISIQSEEGVGTTVTIEVFVQGVSEREEAVEKKIDHLVRNMDELDFSGFRALVLSSEKIGQEVMALRLKQFGLQVEKIDDGQAALDRLLQSEENEIHIMFTDVRLPSLSGLELTRKLRLSQRDDLSDLPIVALTSHVFRDERIEALESGMDYHLALPVDDFSLREILVRELFDFSEQKEYEVRGFRIVK